MGDIWYIILTYKFNICPIILQWQKAKKIPKFRTFINFLKDKVHYFDSTTETKLTKWKDSKVNKFYAAKFYPLKEELHIFSFLFKWELFANLFSLEFITDIINLRTFYNKYVVDLYSVPSPVFNSR